MTWEIFSGFIQSVATQITAWGIILTAVWKISKGYREKREEQKKSQFDELKQIREEEHEDLVNSIETAFKPHIERGMRTRDRVVKIEKVVDDHNKRIATLERDKHGNYHYKEHYKKEND